MHRSFAEQHPILLGLGVLFAVAFVITYWPVFVAAGIAYGAYLGARAAVRRHRRRCGCTPRSPPAPTTSTPL